MKVFAKIFFAFTALSILMGIGVFGIIIYISYDLPQINSLSDYNPPIPSRIYSKDEHLLLELAKERREIVEIDDVPPFVIDAFLSAEDDNFYNHSGVDYIGIIRAMKANVFAGKIVQGASTITQQVAKSLLLSSERTYTRKIKDLILAKKIEQKFTKKEILYLYLNQVYLGGGYYGIKSAVRGYFDKELAELTVAESALIAGLLVAPGKYSPYVNPKRAKIRQGYVLKRMKVTGKISEQEFEEAKNEEIRIRIRRLPGMKAGYFTDWIRQRLIAHFGKEEFLTNGYDVVTSIDWKLQEKAEERVKRGVEEIDKRQGFKGPLYSLDTSEKRDEFILKQREVVHKKASSFFLFKPDGTSIREYLEDDKYFEKRREFIETRNSSLKGWRNKYFEVGTDINDKIIPYFEHTGKFEAIVTKVIDKQRMIYLNYAGLKLAIPYDYFKWAHTRTIQEDRNYWSYVKKPSNIVEKGDVVLVSFMKPKLQSVWKFIYKDFKDSIKDKKLVEEIKKEKYYIVQLDQEADVQGALLSISPNSGEIISMVGGSDFRKSQFNRVVQSNRQPGSAFKPLIFAVGLENGFTPASILLDSPQALGSVDSNLSWKPRNYDGKFKGTMTLRRALEVSRNIPTIRLSQDIGVPKIINFVERLNLKVDLPNDLSVSLGSFGLNLLNLVKLYSIFPNGGRRVVLKSILSIKDRYGKVHYLDDEDDGRKEEKVDDANTEMITAVENEESNKVDEELLIEKNPFLVNLNEDQIYDPRLAYLMSNLLKGVVQNGTGRNAKSISSFIGGKTGTTNNFIDAWFLGFSSKVVTGVWAGFDNNKTLGWGETGAKAALPIWKDFMRLCIDKYGESDFDIPSGIVNVTIDKDTGRLATSTSNNIIESFVVGTEPGAEKDEVLDENDQDSESSIMENDDFYSGQ